MHGALQRSKNKSFISFRYTVFWRDWNFCRCLRKWYIKNSWSFSKHSFVPRLVSNFSRPFLHDFNSSLKYTSSNFPFPHGWSSQTQEEMVEPRPPGENRSPSPFPACAYSEKLQPPKTYKRGQRLRGWKGAAVTILPSFPFLTTLVYPPPGAYSLHAIGCFFNKVLIRQTLMLSGTKRKAGLVHGSMAQTTNVQ